MFSISIKSGAEKQLGRLERQLKNRVLNAITDLAVDSQPFGCRKIKSEAGVWRIRVGDFRIGYTIDHAKQTITIIRIAHRREFYD